MYFNADSSAVFQKKINCQDAAFDDFTASTAVLSDFSKGESFLPSHRSSLLCECLT